MFPYYMVISILTETQAFVNGFSALFIKYFPEKIAEKHKKTARHRLLTGCSFNRKTRLFYFFDFRRFTRKPSEIVEFRSSYLTRSYNGYVSYLRGMQGKTTFYAHAERQTSYGERFADAAVFLGEHNAFEVLDSFLSAFDDTITDFHGIADVELGNFLLHVLGFDLLNEPHDFTSDFTRHSYPLCDRGMPEVSYLL